VSGIHHVTAISGKASTNLDFYIRTLGLRLVKKTVNFWRATPLALARDRRNEHDLVPFGQAIARGAAVLSPRGKVVEHGMPRFFRRFAEGVFDEEDVRLLAHELADFVEEARKQYGIAAPIALGYSAIPTAPTSRRPR
jgi:catechol 2,3-dioxygenase-like lactoylglutathione lyase family enzyme